MVSSDKRKSRLLSRDKIDIYIVIVMAIIFSSLWYYVELQKYLSFNAYLYDLGTETASLISLAHTSSLSSFLIEITPSRPIMVLFVPIVSAFPSPETLLFIQAIFVGFAGIPLYAIAKEYSRNVGISAIITAAYFLFFPLNRMLYFDFHFMALFSFFFFIGYYLYIKKNKWFILFFLLASLTDIALALAPILIIFSGIARNIWYKLNSKKARNEYLNKFNLTTEFLALFLSSFVFFFYIYMTSVGSLVSFGSSSGPNTGLLETFANNIKNAWNYGTPILFLSFIPLVPLFFVPAKNWKIAYIMMPFLLMFFFSGYPFWLFNAQYMGAFLTPLFFVMVSGLFHNNYKVENKIRKNLDGNNSIQVISFDKKHSDTFQKAAILFLALVMVISVYYAPWGPLNSSSTSAYGYEYNSFANFREAMDLTHTEKVADRLFSMVPDKSTVLMQDNMPVLSGRERNYMFGPGLLPWLNATGVSYSPGPVPKSNIPSYIALDVQSWFTTWLYNSTDGTMQSWFTYFYDHYDYGLLGYDYPFALYERNYTGEPVIENNLNIPVNEMLNLSYPLDNKFTVYPVVVKPFLLPGKYSAYFNITVNSVSNFSSNDQLDFSVAHFSNFGDAYSYVNPAFNASSIGKEITIELNFTIKSPALVSYYVNSYNFNGSIVFRGGAIQYKI